MVALEPTSSKNYCQIIFKIHMLTGNLKLLKIFEKVIFFFVNSDFLLLLNVSCKQISIKGKNLKKMGKMSKLQE